MRGMKYFTFPLVCLISILVCQAEMRQWTSATGQKITAELVTYDKEASKVTIKKKNNKTYTLATDKLSEADREWLEQWHKEQEGKRVEEEAKRAEMNKNAGKTVSLTSEGDLPTSYHVYYPKNFDASKHNH